MRRRLPSSAFRPWGAVLGVGMAATLALAGCDFSESARTGPADELPADVRPYAAPLGELFSESIPGGLRGSFDHECLGAAYILGFGLDALVVPGANPATLGEDDLVADAPADVDVDDFVGAVRQCGDVRVYAALIGGTRWAREPLTAEQLRCAAGRMDEARAARLLRTSIVVEEGVSDETRDAATREIVDHLAACGAPMSGV